MGTFPENIAHFTHGMAFMFFIFVGAHLYWQQNKSRLLWFLFYEVIFFAFIEMKDMVYLIEGVWYTDYLTRILLSLDMDTGTKKESDFSDPYCQLSEQPEKLILSM